MTTGGDTPPRAEPRGHLLLHLQEVDDRIAQLRKEVADLEAVLAGDPELESLRASASAAEQERQAAEERSRAVERELTGLRHRARTLDRHLYDGSVRNPQELLGLQHDLAALRPHLDELEGRLLEWMEATDAAEAVLATARAAVAAREEERGSQEAPRRQRLDLAGRELEDVVASRAEAATAAGPADLRLYERVAPRRRPAVVRLEGASCGGCHLPLGIREVNQVRAGDGLVQCSNCDRVVVR